MATYQAIDATSGQPIQIFKLTDGTNYASLGVFHNADNQAVPSTSYGILTGGVDQLVNASGNLDRKRSVQGATDAYAGVGMEASGNFIFNGSTWDKHRSVQSITADGNNGLGVEASGEVGFNGTTWDRMRTVGGVTDAYSGVGVEAAGEMGYNGSTFDRMRTITGVTDAYSGVGVEATGLVAYNGTTFDRVRAISLSGADGWVPPTAGVLLVGAANMGFNGATFDRIRVSNGKAQSVAVAMAGTALQTAVWTPTSGKKFRLQTLTIAADVAGLYTIQDGTTGAILYRLPLSASVPVSLELPPNGIVSAAANNVLMVNSPAATGNVYVTAIGNEE